MSSYSDDDDDMALWSHIVATITPINNNKTTYKKKHRKNIANSIVIMCYHSIISI
ncbi:hypothetical protein [Ehrlichia ruminantium]|uniref:hypothetical protein n=1 Tax=Ehrlichia ruminantium TaxID=779 RepID=UPI00214B3810|nr:hypothetical protein [Ehrlichia ruminantium]